MQYTDVLKIVLETSCAERLLPTTLNSAEVAGGSRWCVGEGRSASVLPFQINHQLLFEIKPITAELPYLHMTESVPVWKQWHYEYNVLCCGKTRGLESPGDSSSNLYLHICGLISLLTPFPSTNWAWICYKTIICASKPGCVWKATHRNMYLWFPV